MLWLVAGFLAAQAAILSLVNKIVPDDYMDEIFHGPQGREYCRGAFASWHPKITTFPGIYYLGTLYGWARWAVQALVSPVQLDAACSTPFLRSLNVLLSAACLIAIGDILATFRQQTTAKAQQQTQTQTQQQQQTQQPSASQAGAERGVASSGRPGAMQPRADPSYHALLLALYPLHWFFSFLYYTDVASLYFLLLTQLQVARRRYLLAAAAGAVAVLMRQTNAVWTAFLLGEAALAEIGLDWAPTLLQGSLGAPPPGKVPPVRVSAAPGRTAGNPGAAGAGAGVGEGEGQGGGQVSALGQLPEALRRMWQLRARLAARLWPLLLPPAGFVAFLVANDGSVVLGDKEAHKPVRHGAQLLYFGGWAALMLWPQLLPALGVLRRAAARRPLAAAAAAAAVVAAAGLAHVSTMVHPYVLADNRHYVFYLWRRLLGRSPGAKFALAPVYSAAWAALLAALLRRVSVLWVAGFLVCLTAQLLPAWLLELRYFTPGFYLMALRLEPPSRAQAAALLLMYGAVNAATMYLFLFRPYDFADGSVARFLW